MPIPTFEMFRTLLVMPLETVRELKFPIINQGDELFVGHCSSFIFDH